MQLIKFKILDNYKDEIIEYQKQYSNLLHCCFNIMYNDLKNNALKSLYQYKNKTYQLIQKINKFNHIELLKNWLIQSCISESYQMILSFQYKIEIYNKKIKRKNELLNNLENLKKYEKIELKKLENLKYPKIIFGGRSLFINRCKNLISKEFFQLNKLSTVYSLGQKFYHGNRLFRINKNLESITFSPLSNKKFELKLLGISKSYKNILKLLYNSQQAKELSITYKLSYEYIYIFFDEKELYKNIYNFNKIKDRYCALDLNPNYIGYSIIDWYSNNKFKIIDKGVYSFNELNNLYNDEHLDNSNKKLKYKSNKRNYEIIEVSKNLIKKCCYYKVENFIVEDLNISSSNKNKGKNFNKLINNIWIRNKFLNNIQKRCNIFKINFIKVKPEYSSFVGNFIFRYLNLPDQILSSIEISRRGYEFNHQYIIKDKDIKKNIIKIDINNDIIFKERFRKSLEEFSISENFKDIIDVYFYFKRNSRFSYRVSLEYFSSYFRHFLSKHSLIFKY